MKVQMTISTLLRAGAFGALAFTAACAGSQTKPDRGPGDDTVGAGKDVDPLADVRKPTPGKAGPARKIDADEKEDFDKAIAKFEKMKAGCALKKGDCDDAASLFEKVADNHPNLLEARHNHAAVLFECGKQSQAIQIWERLAGGAKPYTPAITSLAYLAWKRGDVEKAQSMFDRAIQLDQKVNSVPARLNLALILRDKARQASASERGRLNEQAQTQLRAVLALDGNNLQAYAALAYIYFDLRLLDAAILVGNQAIGRAQEIATGKSLEEGGSSDEASADKGGGKRERGKKGKAAKDDEPKRSKETGASASGGTGYTPEMKRALGQVYNTLGLVALKKKSVSDAIANFKRAVDNDPELYEARMNWAALALNFRDYASAEQNLRAVLAAQPKNYEAAVGLGVALRGQKKFDEAEQQYLAAQKIDPSNPDAYFNLGVLYQEYKGSDRAVLQKAQEHYREFLAKASSSAKKREVEKRIKDIDEMFVALQEAEKLQKEAEELQRKSEEQQKKMEEEMKKQEPKAGGAEAGTSPSATAPPPTKR